MPKFRMSDIGTIESAPTSPASLRNKLSDMILSSVPARARVELVNQDTGEYRIAGARKIRITVETESRLWASEHVLAGRLLKGFPHLARHECRVHTSRDLAPASGTPIQLVEDEPSANQAHLLEHLAIDLPGVFEPRVRRSGLPRHRVEHALALLAHTSLVSEEPFALNFSGEARYRHR